MFDKMRNMAFTPVVISFNAVVSVSEKAARQQEIEALQQAKAILSGA